MTQDDEIMTGDPHWNDFPGAPLLNFFSAGVDISGALSQDVLVTYSYGFLFLYTLTSPLDKVRDREKNRERERGKAEKLNILVGVLIECSYAILFYMCELVLSLYFIDRMCRLFAGLETILAQSSSHGCDIFSCSTFMTSVTR